MKKILTIAIMVMACISVSAQVQFTKWKVKTQFWTSFYTLELQYVITTDKDVKYIHYGYYAVNAVGDVVMSQKKVVDPTPVGYYEHKVKGTGPFVKGKKYKRFMEPATITKESIVLIPSYVNLEYMDGTEDEIKITEENITQYFPTVKWRDYNVPDVVQE